jgi:hypothetical protein
MTVDKRLSPIANLVLAVGHWTTHKDCRSLFFGEILGNGLHRQLTSALGLAGTVPSSAERVAAMQLLDREVSSNDLLDPAGFAREVDGTSVAHWAMTGSPRSIPSSMRRTSRHIKHCKLP